MQHLGLGGGLGLDMGVRSTIGNASYSMYKICIYYIYICIYVYKNAYSYVCTIDTYIKYSLHYRITDSYVYRLTIDTYIKYSLHYRIVRLGLGLGLGLVFITGLCGCCFVAAGGSEFIASGGRIAIRSVQL